MNHNKLKYFLAAMRETLAIIAVNRLTQYSRNAKQQLERHCNSLKNVLMQLLVQTCTFGGAAANLIQFYLC